MVDVLLLETLEELITDDFWKCKWYLDKKNGDDDSIPENDHKWANQMQTD